MCQPEIYVPSLDNWRSIQDEIIKIEQESFPDHPYSDQELQDAFINPENTIVLFRNVKTQQIIGYTYTVAIDKWYPEKIAERKETVLVDTIALTKEYRGKRLTGYMMALLENELRKKHYFYFEICANIPNGLAASIAKVYKDRIVAEPKRTPEEEDKQWGARIWYRIRL